MGKKILIPIILVLISIGIYLYYLNHNREEAFIYYGEAIGQTFHVSTSLGGLVKEIHVKEGESVDIGQLVALIDNGDMDYKIDQAMVQSKILQAQLEKSISPARQEEMTILKNNIKRLDEKEGILKNSYRSVDLAYQGAVLNEDLTKALYENSQMDFQNTQALYDQGVDSQNSLNNAALALKTSKNNFENSKFQSQRLYVERETVKGEMNILAIEIVSAQALLDQATNGVEERDRSIAELHLKNSQINVESLKKLGDDRNIKILKAGVVETINYEVGEYVTPGTPIMTLYNPQTLSVKIYVAESDLAHIKVGRIVDVSIANNASVNPVQGAVKKIANQAMFSPLNIITVKDRERLVFEVEIALARPDYMHPGMLLKVQMHAGGKNE